MGFTEMLYTLPAVLGGVLLFGAAVLAVTSLIEGWRIQ